MSDNKGNLSMGVLGALLGLIPLVGNGILFVFGITKVKPAAIAVSAACLFNTFLLGLVLEDGFALTLGFLSAESIKVIICILFTISFLINAVFCMDFFYKYSDAPFSLFYPEGKRRNAVATEKKILNGIIGFLLGVFPIASSVSCFLLSVKVKNRPAGIISLFYLVGIMLLMRNYGSDLTWTIPFMGVFMLFSGIVFYNCLGYKEEIPVSAVTTATTPPVTQTVPPPPPLTNTTAPTITATQVTNTTTTIKPETQVKQNPESQQGRILDI